MASVRYYDALPHVGGAHGQAKTRLKLTGRMIVARDIAHARIKERLACGRRHVGLYEKPPGLLRGSGQNPGGDAVRVLRADHCGPDGFLCGTVPGGRGVSCDAGEGQPLRTGEGGLRGLWRFLSGLHRRSGRLAQDCIRKVEVLEYPELGMEAVWQIEVEDFPAFIVMDDKGKDFFADFGIG